MIPCQLCGQRNSTVSLQMPKSTRTVRVCDTCVELEGERYANEHNRMKRARAMFRSAKQTARLKGDEFCLEMKLLENAIEFGKCQITGIPFSNKSDAFAPYIMRIDPNGAYEPSNVLIVCRIYGHMIRYNTHEEIVRLARALT